jgi:hypothetical protein
MFVQVKDTMRLLGVIKSLPAITSRIGVGGAASSWVIKEFVAQIHTVSKVALHRKSNMASFLETHGIKHTFTLAYWIILYFDTSPGNWELNHFIKNIVYVYGRGALTQSGRTLPRIWRKRGLHSLGCPLSYMYMDVVKAAPLFSFDLLNL